MSPMSHSGLYPGSPGRLDAAAKVLTFDQNPAVCAAPGGQRANTIRPALVAEYDLFDQGVALPSGLRLRSA